MTWDRVDFARGVILLERTKTGTRREIPMNTTVYDVLRALPRDDDGGRVFRGTSIRTAFLSACTRAKVVDFKFHDLRHTFASWLVMRGRPLKEVQPERLRDAVSVLDDFAGLGPAPEVSTWRAHAASPAPASLVTTRQD